MIGVLGWAPTNIFKLPREAEEGFLKLETLSNELRGIELESGVSLLTVANPSTSCNHHFAMISNQLTALLKVGPCASGLAMYAVCCRPRS